MSKYKGWQWRAVSALTDQLHRYCRRHGGNGQQDIGFGGLLLALLLVLGGGLSGCQPAALPEASTSSSPDTRGGASTASQNQTLVSPPTASITSNKVGQPVGAEESPSPLMQVLGITAKVHYRLRYYGEEIKTTLQPQKQQALFDDVRHTVSPACVQISQWQTKVADDEIAAVTAMLAVLYELDQALAHHNRTAIRQALRRFNPAYQTLQAQAAASAKTPATEAQKTKTLTNTTPDKP